MRRRSRTADSTAGRTRTSARTTTRATSGAFPDLVKRAIVPDVLIPAHSAALGITFYTGTQFPQRYRNGAFVALHGSWNRSVASGYKVVFVPMNNGRPGPLEDFVTGFIVERRIGRRTDLALGTPGGRDRRRDGSLLVSDDGAQPHLEDQRGQSRHPLNAEPTGSADDSRPT